MYTPEARETIEKRIMNGYISELGSTVPIFRRAFVRIQAKVIAGVVWAMQHLVAWAMKQIFIQLMDTDFLQYLADWYNLPRKAASTAILTATATGDSGTQIDAGRLVSFGSIVFSVRTLATLVDGSVTFEIECLTAGADGNLEAGTVLSFPSPVIGVTSIEVAGISVEGKDIEDKEVWRARIRARMRTAPQGGAYGDYIQWACEVPGIVAAYVKRTETGVYVYPLAAKTGPSRVPGTAKITEVQTYIQDPIRRPLCANVYALPALERTVAATITGLDPVDEVMKSNIVTAFEKYVYGAYPRQFSDETNPTNMISVGGVWAIIIAQGAIAAAVSLTISGIGAGSASYMLPIGEIAKPGVVAWG